MNKTYMNRSPFYNKVQLNKKKVKWVGKYYHKCSHPASWVKNPYPALVWTGSALFTNKGCTHTQLLMGLTAHHHPCLARSVLSQCPHQVDSMMSQRPPPTAGGPRLPPGTAGGPRRAPSTADRIMSRRISSGLKPLFPRTPRRPGRQGGTESSSPEVRDHS